MTWDPLNFRCGECWAQHNEPCRQVIGDRNGTPIVKDEPRAQMHSRRGQIDDWPMLTPWNIDSVLNRRPIVGRVAGRHLPDLLAQRDSVRKPPWKDIGFGE